jgi:enoyl-CoA hydratase
MDFKDLYIGQFAEMTKVFNLEDVKNFALLSGDINPVHLDENYAATTIFKKPIVHGFLWGSLVSALIANKLPGPGSIYIHQELNFKAPVFHGNEVTAKVEITDLRPDKKIITLQTTIIVNKNVLALDGKAIVKLI